MIEHSTNISTIDRMAFIGNYLPRQCGIATFTTDLCEAIAGLSGKAEELASLLQLRYGYGRIQADMAIRNWLYDYRKEHTRH